jgi:hypothetical protein
MVPLLIYGSENWALISAGKRWIERTEMKILLFISGLGIATVIMSAVTGM